MSLVKPVPVTPRPVAQLEPVIGTARYQDLIQAADRFRGEMSGRAVWNISSTAVGGGVAEMLHALLGYVEDLGIPSHWMVITGDAGFFVITKRLHHELHGDLSGGILTAADAGHYARMLAANAVELLGQIRPGDIVLLHDPQTAGLTEYLTHAGALVAWRSHIGVDWQNDATEAAWSFLEPQVVSAKGFVFSRREYVPPWMPAHKVAIIPPSIDPFSPKNQWLDDATVRGILATIGVLDGSAPREPTAYVCRDGSTGHVRRPAEITGASRPGPDDPLVVQVSRWDPLKDMAGVMHGFARYVAPFCDGYLVLAGPAVAGVTDDPEGAAVFADCLLQWQDLPAPVRHRILLVTLPLDDPDENAAMVNALQRHASVIVQKSLAEGFGLTVAEGRWKGRPVIGSAVRELLTDPAEADRMGHAAMAHINGNYVGDKHLLRYEKLFAAMAQDQDER